MNKDDDWERKWQYWERDWRKYSEPQRSLGFAIEKQVRLFAFGEVQNYVSPLCRKNNQNAIHMQVVIRFSAEKVPERLYFDY